MKFIVHVIDEISNHILKEDRYELMEVEDENGDKGHVFRTDAFYYVEEESPIDAVVSVVKIIKIIDSNKNSKYLANVLGDMGKKSTEDESVKISEGEINPEIYSSYSKYNYNNKTDSELFFATCQFEREEDEEKWVEFHRFSIYAIEEKKAVKVPKK